MRDRIPSTWNKFGVGTILTNFDHSIDYDVKKRLDKGRCWAAYAGWDFYGYVWKHSKGYSCEIWTYKEYNKTFHALDLQSLMDDVSEEYGVK